jgi:hypothetical protein
MKRTILATASFAGFLTVMLGATHPAMTPKVSGAPGAQGTVAGSVIRFVAGSTVKLEQLLGEEDKEKHQPTLSLTETRYGIRGTDLGNSFEHNGRVYFLFGDTVGRLDHALDTIATTDAIDPEQGVRLDFLMAGRDYLTIQPPGISMGAFEVPVAGVSLGGQMYVVVSTDHSQDRGTDRSVLTRFTLPATFQPLRTMSQLPAGHFVKMSVHTQPGPIAGMPSGPLRPYLGYGCLPPERCLSFRCSGSPIRDWQGDNVFRGNGCRGRPIVERK